MTSNDFGQSFSSNTVLVIIAHARRRIIKADTCCSFEIPLVKRTGLQQLLGRVALVRGGAGYSHQTFPWTICRSVCLSVRASVGLSHLVCPVHCGKTSDRIRMAFGIIGRTGPRMRQVVGFGNRVHGKGYFWARISVQDRDILTMED